MQTFDDIARLNVSKESLSLITSSSHEEIINRVAEVGYEATLINAPQVEEEQIEVTADEPAQQEKIAEPKVATEEPTSVEPEPAELTPTQADDLVNTHLLIKGMTLSLIHI